MLTRFDISRSRVALGVGAAALTVGGVSLAWANAGGPAPTAAFTPATSTESVGDISGPCDEAENAAKPECAGTAIPGTGSTAPAPPASPAAPQSDGTDVRGFDAAGAGTVTYAVEGPQLTLVSATPAAGWVVEIERASGVELDLDFRAGARRVQVDVEFEDGGIRERVRLRDDALGTETETVNGTATGDDRDDDDRSGPGDGSDVEDRSGPSGTSGTSGDDGADDEGHDVGDDHGGDDDRGSGEEESDDNRSGPGGDDDTDDTDTDDSPR